MVGSMPNAFILGVAKAGTSSLARSLGEHPEVFVPETKEPNYYLLRHGPLNAKGGGSPKAVAFMLHRFSIADPDAYRSLYAPGAEAAFRIDGSVRYLYHPEALESLVAAHPGARHIVVLRDPAERAISHWRMNRQNHLEPLSLPDALAAEDERVAAGWAWDWHYRRVGTYAPQLRRLFDMVPQEDVLVVRYGDFVRDPQATVDACFGHLGVPPHPVGLGHRLMSPSEPRWALPDRLVEHPTAVRTIIRKHPRGPRFIDWVRSHNTRPPGPVDTALVEDLRRTFEADLGEVATLLGSDLDSLRIGLTARKGPTPAGGTPS